MQSEPFNIRTKTITLLLQRWATLVLFLCSLSIFSQSPKIASSVDTTFIKIGDQVKWSVTIETDTTAQVIFPDGQTFSPLETVEAFATDTTRKKSRMLLQKSYALTQFDSGAYKLPAQRIEINGVGYFTDSLMVNVATVPVDTLKQQMFDIKPLLEVEKSNADLWKTLLWILLGLTVLGALFYWFVLRKKPLTEEEKVALLPPYDRALLELKNLENSKYLIQDEYKQYYSELTDIVRSYLEEDVHVSALESTTDELITKLELLKDAGELELDTETLNQFKNILQTADLVKFAKSKPPTSVAEQDRKSIEQIVIKTHDALPEPTEEELMQQAEYQEELLQKKQKKKIVIGIAAMVAVLFIAIGIAIARYGFSYLKDSVVGHPTKELLEGEWVASSYGYPPIQLETPKVLVRQEVALPDEAKEAIKEIQNFGYRSAIGLFTMETVSLTFKEPVEFNPDPTVDQIIGQFESQGAKNIITKKEEFTTISGTKGLKIFGSGKFPLPGSEELVKGNYTIVMFGTNGVQQYLVLSWLEDDTYAKEIADRILKTLEVKLTV